jgi:hypothetical protein
MRHIMPKKKRVRQKASAAKYVKVKNNAYGNKLKGTKIYFEGKRPSGLKNDGMISFGKHILELLTRKYDRSSPSAASSELELLITHFRD